MKSRWKMLIRVVTFLCIFIAIFFALEEACFDDTSVSPVWDIVQNSQGESLDILFMGNSHMYCSVNPWVINEALDIETAILGSSSQYMEITLENLEVVLKYQKPKAIVLGAFAVLNDDKQTVKEEKQGFLYDNYDGIHNCFYKAKAIAETMMLEDVPSGQFQLLRPTERWARWNTILARPRAKTLFGNGKAALGHRRQSKVVAGDVSSPKEVQNYYEAEYLTDANEELLVYQKDAFITFLDITQRNNIPVWIIKSPTLRKNHKAIARMKKIEEITASYENVKAITDFHLQMDKMGIETEDFYDTGHLNQRGASKFTEYLTNMIGEAIGVEPDYSDVFYYKDEYMMQMADGTQRYVVECYDDAQYRFGYTINGKRSWTKWSEDSFFDLPQDAVVEELSVQILPVEIDPNSADSASTRLSMNLLL